jgi:hypothetical protein
MPSGHKFSRRHMNKDISNLTLALITISLFLSSSAVAEETAKYCDTLNNSGPSLNYNHTLLLFDPGLGNLVRVDLTADLRVLQNYSLENEVQVGQNVSAESEVMLLITKPDSSSISVNASGSVSEVLAAYDGKTDFGGPSGRTIEGVTSNGSAEKQYLELSDFAASFQNETISLPAAISIRSSTTGSVVFGLSTIAESKVCVIYTYEPKAQEKKGDTS